MRASDEFPLWANSIVQIDVTGELFEISLSRIESVLIHLIESGRCFDVIDVIPDDTISPFERGNRLNALGSISEMITEIVNSLARSG